MCIIRVTSRIGNVMLRNPYRNLVVNDDDDGLKV